MLRVCTAWAARLTSAVQCHGHIHNRRCFQEQLKRHNRSRLSSVVGLHRGPARDNARVTSTASVELLGLHLPRAAAAAPVAMWSPSHTMCHQMRCVAHTMSPCATHHVPRTAYQARAGGRHLPRGPAAWCYGERAPHVTCCVAANRRPPSGRNDAPDSWRAWRGVPLGPPTPSGARARRACVPRPRSNNGRSSARPAAATPPLRTGFQPAQLSGQPAQLHPPTRPHL